MIATLNKKLRELCEKYDVPQGTIAATKSTFTVQTSDGKKVLLPWRVERRFVELKKIVDENTVEDVSTLRFCAIVAGGDVLSIAARELDVASWMIGEKIRSLFATCAQNAAVNIIAKFANDVSASIECGVNLPEGKEPVEFHEIIAQRGVASDRAVDIQAPQSSIYAFSENETLRFTDTDAELFGLKKDEVGIVRAAFAVLKNPALGDQWNAAAVKMQQYREAIKKSCTETSNITLEEVGQ